MKILFLTRFETKDVNIWSGSLFHIYRKLSERCDLEVIGTELLNQLDYFKKGNFPSGGYVAPDRYTKNLNSLLSERINSTDCDLVFFGDLLFVPL